MVRALLCVMLLVNGGCLHASQRESGSFLVLSCKKPFHMEKCDIGITMPINLSKSVQHRIVLGRLIDRIRFVTHKDLKSLDYAKTLRLIQLFSGWHTNGTRIKKAHTK